MALVKKMLNSLDSYVIVNIGKAPTPKWMPPMQFHVLTDIASSVCRQVRHFYFFLSFLSLVRKARNAIIMLPKVANNVSIPMNIEIISNAVILRIFHRYNCFYRKKF